MGKSKKTPFPIWQTCKPDGIEQRYILLGNSLLLHPAWLSLSDKAKVIYVHMLLESGSKQDFTFTHSKYSKLASKAVFQRAKEELIDKGFISEKQNNANLRKPNVYMFSENWKQYEPP